jgi:hypothetical protein
VIEYGKLDLNFLVKVSFDRIMTWRPVSSYGLSQEKFVKVMREAKLFEGKKSKQMNQIETIFIKEVRKGAHAVGEKHVNQDGWKAMLIEAAATRFPVATGRQAAAMMESPQVQADLLQHILHNYICMVSDITEYVEKNNCVKHATATTKRADRLRGCFFSANRAIWTHCKMLAIQSEGVRYCAAACIQVSAPVTHARLDAFVMFCFCSFLDNRGHSGDTPLGRNSCPSVAQ